MQINRIQQNNYKKNNPSVNFKGTITNFDEIIKSGYHDTSKHMLDILAAFAESGKSKAPANASKKVKEIMENPVFKRAGVIFDSTLSENGCILVNSREYLLGGMRIIDIQKNATPADIIKLLAEKIQNGTVERMINDEIKPEHKSNLQLLRDTRKKQVNAGKQEALKRILDRKA